MRLWHKDLIEVLPNKQLLGQWRECCAIASNIANKGTPKHLLVNKVVNYASDEFNSYTHLVYTELQKRGYNINIEKFWHWRDDINICLPSIIFRGWHNHRYLIQCYYNLEEKYDCGGILEDDFIKIHNKVFKG